MESMRNAALFSGTEAHHLQFKIEFRKQLAVDKSIARSLDVAQKCSTSKYFVLLSLTIGMCLQLTSILIFA